MLRIRIAEKNASKRGELFEGMIRDLLEQQEYEIIKLNQVKQGYELDFTARHKGHRIIGECKAHKNKINASDIHKFYGKLMLEKGSNGNIRGEFYSLSPLTGSSGAEGVVSQIKDRGDITFMVYAPEAIAAQLIKNDIVSKKSDFENMKEEFHSVIDRICDITDKKLDIEEVFLEYFNREYYWICLVSGYKKLEKYFLILDREGNIPRENLTLVDVFKENEDLLKDRTYLPYDSLDLDSKRLLSAIMRLDKGNHWKVIFIDSIDLLKDKGDYITIAEIFEKIGVLRHECTEEDLYQKAKEIGDRIQSYDTSEIDEDTRNPLALKLYYFAKEGYLKLENEKKVKEVSEKIKTIEEERKQEEDKEEEDMAEEKGADV